ncbi:Uu.00g016150.m01.CDS01 [Anthostomella pinea]|uniref:Uu.00g016150.m01.CDS01 n=1 Tax=Anthostomella pinea TaxID=933095 RepID=A0AAI8VSV3_9PEZI|nr:Uu.00g016150.m01.CDS01 [Anthostomella pinea]
MTAISHLNYEGLTVGEDNEELDKDQSRKIWKMNIKRFEKINAERERAGWPPIHFNKRKILQYADRNFDNIRWNGRQIRNAFQTALALADYKVRDTPTKSPSLSTKEFRTIAGASRQFDEYLHATHGADEEKIAQTDKVRGVVRQRVAKKLHSLPGSEESGSSSDSDDDRSSSSNSASDDSSFHASHSGRKKKTSTSKKHASKKKKDKRKGESKLEKERKKKKKKKGQAKKEAEDSGSNSDTNSDSDD